MSDSSRPDRLESAEDLTFKDIVEQFMPDKNDNEPTATSNARQFLLTVGTVCVAVLMVALTIKAVLELF